jgi:CRISPR/Cas system-associated protein Csm6
VSENIQTFVDKFVNVQAFVDRLDRRVNQRYRRSEAALKELLRVRSEGKDASAELRVYVEAQARADEARLIFNAVVRALK